MTTKPSGQTVFLAAVVAGSCVLVGYLLLFYNPARTAQSSVDNQSRLTLAEIPFNGQRAYEYLMDLCALGPRVSGSQGMHAQQKLLATHFQNLGGKVRFQKFRIRHPQTGKEVAMSNLIVEWQPQRRERVLLCAHYDTRPFPDKDTRNPRGAFVGANDGAIGTALLMELAHQMTSSKGKLGVDFVLFDGEEFILEEGRDPYFIGSEFFATAYANARPGTPRYRWGVLVDMVADADLQIYPDSRSMSWDDTRPVVEAIFDTAARLGVREFVAGRRYEVLDDHIKLHDIGKIPCCDIIDFKYPAWHTQDDTPANCSALSLAKVGWVLQEWLKQAVRQ
ncbi:MAG: M28 family peptidase [Planctomycetia bacterium]|nr:M28 family peptidase [Planctomycetia bacterium]